MCLLLCSHNRISKKVFFVFNAANETSISSPHTEHPSDIGKQYLNAIFFIVYQIRVIYKCGS
uniref:Uncharacterized protein n=1 Tax=Anopheles quadriannulatus TaxID=34691 RepID=A0A182XTE4_ANOQN